MDKRDKRERILEAAEELFKQRRFHEITLQEIAQAAKVGKGTIYLYFEDKDDLFFQMVTSGFDDLCKVVERHCLLDAPFVERLRSLCEEVSAFFERRTQMFNIIQGEAAWMPGGAKGKMTQRWMERRKKLIDATTDMLRQGVEEGVVRADLPVEVTAMYLLGMLRTRARDLSDFSKEQRSHHVLVELFCNGTIECGLDKKDASDQKRNMVCAL